MPKKKKKRKVKRKTSKKKSVRRKVKRKTSKKKSVRRKAKRKTSKNKKNENRDSPAELIIKSKPEWIRASLASKAQYQKKQGFKPLISHKAEQIISYADRL